jgi:hypothetical protein
MTTSPGGNGGADVNQATMLEEMYLIYKAIRNYLATRSHGGVRSGRSGAFVPLLLPAGSVGGMFLESMLEESMDQAKECSGHYN